MKKSIIAIVLILALFSSAGQALAVESDVPIVDVETETAEIMLTLISSVTPSLSVSGSTASYTLLVYCSASVNSIKAVLQLQQYRNGAWYNYGSSWNASSAKSSLVTNGTKTIASGYSYRLKVTVTASNGSSTGTATVYS